MDNIFTCQHGAGLYTIINNLKKERKTMNKIIETYAELLNQSKEIYNEKPAYLIPKGKSYYSISYNQFTDDVFNLAAAVTSKFESEEKIAVLGENSYHWILSYFGTTVSGKVIVPIDKELTAPEINNILTSAGVNVLFCSDNYMEIANELTRELTIINTTENDEMQALITLGAQLRANNLTFGQNEVPNTLSTIVFTSGTTGFAKGVMLSRRNFFFHIEQCRRLINLKGVSFSVLPMNHTYEFTLNVIFPIYQGGTLAINNSIKYVAQNIKMFKPDYLVVVPLVAQTLMDAVWRKIEEQGKLKSVKNAIKISRALKFIGIDVRRKMFGKILEGFGGNVKQIFVGGSYVSPTMAQQYYDFGIQTQIGYGITECSPLISGNVNNKRSRLNNCGILVPDMEARILDPNESGDGEILVKGENVMLGYYNNPEATQQVLIDGWFYTGDLGHINSRGEIIITGRKKNLIVLNNGKNVYPEEIEMLLGQNSPLITEVVVSAPQNGENLELAIQAEIFVHEDVLAKTPNAQEIIRQEIEQLNETLPYFKRLSLVNFREKEFPKTTTKKIKRY